MKKYIATIVLTIFTFVYASAQSSCLPDGINFGTQEEIDNFQLNYPGCTEIEGSVYIFGDMKSLNTDITNLEGLSMLNSIGGSLRIWLNNKLTDLSGLNQMTSIGGSLSIVSNDTLTTLTALENLTFIGGDLDITNNPSLTNCEASVICDYLSDPSGVINISGNAEGCASLVEAAMACGITMPCLESGQYILTSQYDVDHFPIVFPGCSELEVGVRIKGNDITNLDSLVMITTIGGGLRILSNISLTSLSGLDNLTSIGGSLDIGGWPSTNGPTVGNSSLTSLTGLDNLTSIGGSLYIGNGYGGGNDSLTSLTGLENLNASSIEDLHILYNSSLSTCDVQSICDYLLAPNGTIYISDNATGCNSQEEVELACPVSVDETSQPGELFIYPNPSSTQITIELPDATITNTHLAIYNINTRRVMARRITEQKTILDISSLPAGIYFLKVADDRTMKVGKVIIK